MKFLLDTNACIQIIRHPRGIVAEKFFATPAADMGISIITKAELLVGPYRKEAPPTEHGRVKRIVDKLTVVPFTEQCADEYAKIAAHLLDHGTPIGSSDVQIAATARHLNLIVVTHNIKHFKMVPGLRFEDWQQEPGP